MKKTNLLALLAVIGTTTTSLALGMAGCSSSSSNETVSDSGTPDVTTGDDGGTDSSPGDGSPGTDGSAEAEAAAPPPNPPALGTLIDRMGRPAINTALNHVFDSSCLAPDLCSAKDAYNTDTPANWNADWAGQFAQNLAIFDSLDTVCGNQPGYNAQLAGMTFPGYSLLAAVLAQDALWVNTSNTTCNAYLGVELNTLGVSNSDCGGRTLTENTIDVTYNLVAGTETFNDAGVVGGPATNGVTAPASAPFSTFPYFAQPH
jgi:hypothetical protein